MKRARTEGVDYSTYTKDPDYYFHDGGVRLVVARTLFRVHPGVVMRHSTVFRDMFSVPLPAHDGDESFDGAPVIELDDEVEDLRVLFRLTYDSPYVCVSLFFLPQQ